MGSHAEFFLCKTGTNPVRQWLHGVTECRKKFAVQEGRFGHKALADEHTGQGRVGHGIRAAIRTVPVVPEGDRNETG